MHLSLVTARRSPPALLDLTVAARCTIYNSCVYLRGTNAHFEGGNYGYVRVSH